jgi:hypothetical protein
LLERDIFDLCLPKFDKPWVIHLREIAAVLQTSALGGPTFSTRIEACVDITTHTDRWAIGQVTSHIDRDKSTRLTEHSSLPAITGDDD